MLSLELCFQAQEITATVGQAFELAYKKSLEGNKKSSEANKRHSEPGQKVVESKVRAPESREKPLEKSLDAVKEPLEGKSLEPVEKSLECLDVKDGFSEKLPDANEPIEQKQEQSIDNDFEDTATAV